MTRLRKTRLGSFVMSAAFAFFYRFTFGDWISRDADRATHPLKVSPRWGWAPKQEIMRKIYDGATVTLNVVRSDDD